MDFSVSEADCNSLVTAHDDSNIFSEKLIYLEDAQEHIKIFCEKNMLQFFNFDDISLIKWGYSNQDDILSLSPFEKELLSFKQVELKHVLSTALKVFHEHHIFNLKPFIIYMLQIISTHANKSCVNACETLLKQILKQHPYVNMIGFTSAEIFTFLFNYGVDIDSCQLLYEFPELKGYLPRTKLEYYQNIVPIHWLYNLKILLNVLEDLIKVCKFSSIDYFHILLFFLWMSSDNEILVNDMYCSVQKCVSMILERLPEEDWCHICLKLPRTLLSLKFTSPKQKWKYIYYMVKIISSSSLRGNQLRKVSASLMLSRYCLDTLGVEFSPKDNETFSALELQSLMEHISNMDLSDMSTAVKFLDICLSHMQTIPEDKFFKVLKDSERLINNEAVKLKIMNIYSRLELIYTVF